MKNKCCVLVVLLVMNFLYGDAQIIDNNLKAPAVATRRPPFEITQLDLVADSTPVVGNGRKGYYHAIITYTGGGTVDYQWIIRGNVGPVGNPPPPYVVSGTLLLSGTGTDHVYHTVSIGSHSLTTIQFKTITPVVAFSPTRSY